MTTIALAGRRIDAAGAEPARFPLANVALVRGRLQALFARLRPDRLVCSAACGADLISLDVAHELGVPRCTVVLPFDAERFLRTSVLDRPGDWEALFRAAVARAAAAGELVHLGLADGAAAYAAVNDRIIAEAAEGPAPHIGCVVTDGVTRGGQDFSMGLAVLAEARGWPVERVATV